MKKTIRGIIAEKGSSVWSVTPETMVYDALKLMNEKGVGALLVLEKGKIAGIFSERDYARKVVLHDKSSLKTPVREIMSAKVFCAKPNWSVEQCMALMTDRRTRHLPVVDGDELLGMLSIGDLVKATIEEKDFLIEQLEIYITGSPNNDSFKPTFFMREDGPSKTA